MQKRCNQDERERGIDGMRASKEWGGAKEARAVANSEPLGKARAKAMSLISARHQYISEGEQ
jgi:hypothetical protein